MAVIGDITLGTGINDIVVSGFSAVPNYPVVDATLIAHPSNTGVLYVRKRTTTGFGYPLTAGASLVIAKDNMADYTASGVSGQRLAYIINR